MRIERKSRRMSSPIKPSTWRTPRIDDSSYDIIANMVRFTGPFNATGQPAVSIPTGLSNEGLPLSMQIVGKPFDEVTVLQVADAYERARGPLPLPKI